MNFSNNSLPPPDTAQRSATAGPDEQTLLLYLMEPTSLAEDQLAAIHGWIASSPEHADQLTTLAEQLYCIASHLPAKSTPEQSVSVPVSLQAADSMTGRATWGWLISIAATVLLVACWYALAGQRSTEWADEVALNWAANHETLASVELQPWTDDEPLLLKAPSMNDPSMNDIMEVATAVSVGSPEQPPFGFSDGEPPEWLLAAFIDSGEDSGREHDSVEQVVE